MKDYQTPMSVIDEKPFLESNIVRCEDYCLIDKNNKRYIDLRSGLWNVSLGYNQEWLLRIKNGLNEQLDKRMFYLDAHSYEAELYQKYASRLLDFVNHGSSHFSKVFLTNSGSEGTELALKIIKKAQLRTGRKKILIFKEGYHGTFFGGLSVSGIDAVINSEYQNDRPEIILLPAPVDPESWVVLLKTIQAEKDKLAAVFLEPMISSGGALEIPSITLNTLMAFCMENDILTVMDEVAVGFYRSGSRLYCHRLAVYPDVIILSKTLNNGILPMGSVVIGKRLQRKLSNTYLDHFSTQNGNLLGIRSAYETLGYLVENEHQISQKVVALEQVWKTYQQGLSISGRGAMFAIPMTDRTETFTVMKRLSDCGYMVYFYECYENTGLLLLPPFNLPVKILEDVMEKISEFKNHEGRTWNESNSGYRCE